MKINPLPRELTEKIAAGEVVERPASVVKELLENALDAGADRLLVMIGRDIVDHLEVLDNGVGMSPEEVPFALQRHATSKIRTEEDLYNIETLGFRGEALPSIAVVSDFCLETRTADSPFGVSVEVRLDGKHLVRQIGMSPGTRIIVRNLFRTTPARLKFLRSKQTEGGHIIDTFTRLALSRIDVSFQLKRDGKMLLNAPAVTDLRQRVGQLLGWRFAEDLRNFSGREKGCTIHGLAGSPETHKVGPSGIFLFVNHRPIKDIHIQRAIREAYRGSLPKGRYPVAVVFISVPLSELDVNVHPAKLEVHFAHPAPIHDLIRREITGVLYPAPWQKPVFSGPGHEVSTGDFNREDLPKSHDYDLSRYDRQCQRKSYTENHGESERDPPPAVRDGPDSAYAQEDLQIEPADLKIAPSSFAPRRIIGQFKGAYLVCELRDNLVLIDQHAAHERIVYEKLINSFSEQSIARQGLLVPQMVELAPREADCLNKYLAELMLCGLEVDYYGGNSFAIKSVSKLIADADLTGLLKDIAEELAEREQSNRLDSLHDNVFARMACHSVVRAGQLLQAPEMEVLLQTLESNPELKSCPHGRPIMIAWSLQEIEKRFQRL